jgi:acetate kinase
MTSVILTFNAGSSSIKFAAFSPGENAMEELALGQIEGLGATATFSGMNAQTISDLLYKDSGLKGLSGISHDMRELEAADSKTALNAIAYFVARIRREISGLTATIGGLDAIVFTGGIGENSVRIRYAVLSDMHWIGVKLDRDANNTSAQVISAEDSNVVVFVIKTDEERMIAEHTADADELWGHEARNATPSENNTQELDLPASSGT